MRVFHHWVPGRKVVLFVVEGAAVTVSAACGAVALGRTAFLAGMAERPALVATLAGLLACGVALLQYALYLVDLYDLRVASADRAAGTRVLRAAGLAAGAMGAAALVAAGRVPEGVVLGAALGALFGVLLVRSAGTLLLGPPRRVVILGEGPRAAALKQWLASDGEEGLSALSPPRDAPVEAFVRGQRVEAVVDAREQGEGWPGADALLRCRLEGAEVLPAEDFVERALRRLPIAVISAQRLAYSDGFRSTPAGAAAKRTLDVLGAVALLGLAWPVALVVAVAIRLDSPGPILYGQERVGQGGRSFQLWKFRSMRVDAEANGAAWARKDDDRVTRVGRVIRKGRLDELPQLINVLRGEMSLVGPRPERPVFVAQLRELIPFYALREVAKPGLTGWAQIRYPYGASVEDARNKLEYDLYYLKNRSLFLDAACLFHTVRHVLVGRGAR